MSPKYQHEIDTPAGRKRAYRSMEWVDHGILRHRWHNFEQIAPDVYRSNHPSLRRFEAYAEMGIKAVLNLRGAMFSPEALFEIEICERLGLDLIVTPMAARRAPTVVELNRLFDAFEAIERPFFMHCKSGADRTGLASALYLLHYQNADLATAKAQLSFAYVHIRRTATGVLDHFLTLYEADHAQTGIGVLDWINSAYDPDVLTESFAARQKALRFWQGWRD